MIPNIWEARRPGKYRRADLAIWYAERAWVYLAVCIAMLRADGPKVLFK